MCCRRLCYPPLHKGLDSPGEINPKLRIFGVGNNKVYVTTTLEPFPWIVYTWPLALVSLVVEDGGGPKVVHVLKRQLRLKESWKAL